MNVPLQVATTLEVQTAEKPTTKKRPGSDAKDFLNIMAAMLTTNQTTEENSAQHPPLAMQDGAITGMIVSEGICSVQQKVNQEFAIFGEEVLASQLLAEETADILGEQLLSLENQEDGDSIRADDLLSEGMSAQGLVDQQLQNTLKGDVASKEFADGALSAAENKGKKEQLATETATDVSETAASLVQPRTGWSNSFEGEPLTGSEQVNFASKDGKPSLTAIKTSLGSESAFAATDLAQEIGSETADSVKSGHHEEGQAFAEVLSQVPGRAELADELSIGSQQEFLVAQEELPVELPRIIESQLRDAKGQEIKREFMIQLEPKDLGKLLVKLTEQDGVISVKIITEQLRTKELVESGLLGLRQSLAEQGIKYGQLDVEANSQYLLQQEQQQQHHQQQQQQQQQQRFSETWQAIFSEELWSDDWHSREESSRPLGNYRLHGSSAIDYVV
ncbi:MAG: flagellar hook-length control protein FliK [Peptococcia bacterium]